MRKHTPVKTISYGKQTISSTDVRSVVKILTSDFLTQGPTIEKFESAVAQYCKVKYAVAFSSGTAALHAACFAAAIGKGDEVITTPMTFASTANCILYCGGTPIFADIKSDIPLIDIQKVEQKLTNKTKAILTVDYSGVPADYDEINSIARKNKIVVIADAAHSLGATYKNKKVGTLADMTVFSFHPVKSITTGEGGMVVTNYSHYFERLKLFRTHGITRDSKFLQKKNVGSWFYEMQELGFNYRLTDMQAALGLSQLRRLDFFVLKREKLAQLYIRKLSNYPFISLPQVPEDRTSAWHIFPIRIDFGKLGKSRKEMFTFFERQRIRLQVHYIPVTFHPYYQKRYGYTYNDYPNTKRFYEEEVSLPLYPDLTQAQIHFVVATLKNIVTAR